MTPGRTASPFEPTGRRRELARLVGQIQALTLELQHLWQDGLERRRSTPRNTHASGSVGTAAVAQRAATDELGHPA
jgi:hypothetical protein